MMNALELGDPLRWFVPTSNTEYIRLEHGQPEDRLVVTEDDSETKMGLLLESPFGITLDDCVQARKEYKRDFCATSAGIIASSYSTIWSTSAGKPTETKDSGTWTKTYKCRW